MRDGSLRNGGTVASWWVYFVCIIPLYIDIEEGVQVRLARGEGVANPDFGNNNNNYYYY